jgi:hypothetical protein
MASVRESVAALGSRGTLCQQDVDRAPGLPDGPWLVDLSSFNRI